MPSTSPPARTPGRPAQERVAAVEDVESRPDGPAGRLVGGVAPQVAADRAAAGEPVDEFGAYGAWFQRSTDGVLLTTPDNDILAANEPACRMLGRTEGELRRLGVSALADPADVDRWQAVRRVRETEGFARGEARARRSDGSTFVVDVSAASVQDGAGRPRIIVLLRDLTRYVEVAARAGDMQRAAATVIDTLESISDAYVAVDKNWVVTYINRRGEALLRTHRWDVVGADLWEGFPTMAGTVFEERYREVMTSGEPLEFEAYYGAADLRCEVRAFPLQQGGMAVYLRDVAELYEARQERERLLASEKSAREAAERAQQALAQRATHDEVTGLLNRWGLLEQVERMRPTSPRSSLTMMFIDLDRFKLVNDTLGHSAGDELLAEVGRRLRHLVRESDLLARFGGDEFVIVLQDLPDERAEQLAQQIVAAGEVPVEIGDSTLAVTASVGIARAEGRWTLDTLLRQADTALYRVKDTGRDAFAWFDEGLHRQTVHRLQLEQDLARALEADDQLMLHFQPAYVVATGLVAHVEALIRWHHPTRGLVMPGEFISIAEDSGQVLALGERVIALAAQQAAAWDLPDMRVWVNVSARQLALPGLAEVLAAHLDAAGVPAERFGIEVTESAVADRGRLRAHLEAVRELGVAVAVDDFGTGFSSLSRLAATAVDLIKIDRSFVAASGTTKGRALLDGIVSLSHSIGAHVVAEGVETPEQLAAVTSAGADSVAGYLLARPAPPDEFHADPLVPPPVVA